MTSYVVVRQDITTTMTSLKKFIYFQSSLDLARNRSSDSLVNEDGDKQEDEVEFWHAQNNHPQVAQIYSTLQRLV